MDEFQNVLVDIENAEYMRKHTEEQHSYVPIVEVKWTGLEATCVS